MAYSDYLAERLRMRLSNQSNVEEKRMMGGLVFMVNGKMCAGIDKDKETKEDRMMFRIGKEVYEKALQKKGSRKMDFTGKVMRGFVFVSPEGFDHEEDLDFWLDLALDYNKSLL